MARPAYVLLAEEEDEKVKNSCILSAHNVGVKEGSTNGFPIFLDLESAYAHARKTYLAGQQVAPAFQSETFWREVRLYFTDAQWVANLLPLKGEPPVFAVAKERRSVRSDLFLEGVSVHVEAYKLSAHSLEEWATARLPKRRKVSNEACGECGKLETVAWRGSMRNHLRHKADDDDGKPKAYCAACWDTYFASKR